MKWKGTPKVQQATTKVCAKSGDLPKSYSSRGTMWPIFFSVTVVGTPGRFDLNVVFTPSRLKI